MDIQYKVEFFTDWHCGSGLAAGADVDALVVKDNDGLPFIPGKTIKGLLREAVDNIVDFRSGKNSKVDEERRSLVRKTFGYFDGSEDNGSKRPEMTRGTVHFTNAELSEEERRVIIEEKLHPYLYRTLSSTAIDIDGIARPNSLRRIEVVVPCTLQGEILGLPDNEDFMTLISDAFSYIKRLGQNRNRGLGRCSFLFVSCSVPSSLKKKKEYTLKFKCTLLSDVILNRKSATAGPNETLDFIPGSNFLGIAAAKLYSELSANQSLFVFHSGKVRFGDAHPSVGNFRGLKVPASMFYPKLSKPDNELYIYHLIPSNDPSNDESMRKKQLKQCREGFYDFSESQDNAEQVSEAKKIETVTNFAIKSAYDRTTRRSKDEQLFGYQSLQKGLTMYFSVEIDIDEAVEKDYHGINKEDLKKKIVEALEGIKHIGRSRTAQYGRVEIEQVKEYQEVNSSAPVGGLVTVYADSRLIFLDKFGLPTFRPTAAQLGIDGEIDWEASQIRTFRYAPWNFKRQCFDTDRCGIEKGSVFVVKGCRVKNFVSQYVGSYKNEGFGKVIYNPAFLDGDAKGNARCRLTSDALPTEDKSKHTDNTEENNERSHDMSIDLPLINFLRQRSEQQNGIDVHRAVNIWIDNNLKNFRGKDKFASQWGEIRNIAASAKQYSDLYDALFSDSKGYLVHGVATAKWKDKGRIGALKSFIKQYSDKASFRNAIVNLASEMAKKCQ